MLQTLRRIKTFVMRSGRMTKAQRLVYESALHEKKCIEFSPVMCNFEKCFGNANPVIAEIGFGMGDATVKIAEENPSKNYIGIEVYKSGVARVLCEIQKKNLQNLLIIEHDAIEVFAKMFAPETLYAIHIFFPDPWHKLKHRKRRLFRKEHIERLTKSLKSGGYIYFVTDWDDYAASAAREAAFVPELIQTRENLQMLHDMRGETKFERKALKAGRAIHELIFIKR